MWLCRPVSRSLCSSKTLLEVHLHLIHGRLGLELASTQYRLDQQTHVWPLPWLDSSNSLHHLFYSYLPSLFWCFALTSSRHRTLHSPSQSWTVSSNFQSISLPLIVCCWPSGAFAAYKAQSSGSGSERYLWLNQCERGIFCRAWGNRNLALNRSSSHSGGMPAYCATSKGRIHTEGICLRRTQFSSWMYCEVSFHRRQHTIHSSVSLTFIGAV